MLQRPVLELDRSIHQRKVNGIPGRLYEVDVPDDGACLFYSVVMATLLPLARNKKQFLATFKIMFGEQGPLAEEIWNKLNWYNGNVEFFEKEDGFLPLLRLVDEVFRQRLVNHMRDKELVELAFVQADGHPNLEHYFNHMARSGTWGGDQELKAMSDLLKVHIIVYRLTGKDKLEQVRQEYGTQYAAQVRVLHVKSHYEEVEEDEKYIDHNHYRFLVKSEALDPSLGHALAPGSSQGLTAKAVFAPKPAIGSPEAYQVELDKLKQAVDKLPQGNEKNLGLTLWQALSQQKAAVLSSDNQRSMQAAIDCQRQVINTKQRLAEISKKPSLDNILINIALFLGTLIIGYMVASYIHYKATGRKGFFHKPALASNLPQVSQTLQACAQNANPELREKVNCPAALPDFKEWSSFRI